MNNELTPKQQTSEAIRQAETILVTAGQNPTIDQITAVLGLALVLRKLNKKATGVISDPVPGILGFLPTQQVDKTLTGLRDFVIKLDLAKAEVDKLKYTVEDGKLNVHVTPFKGGFAPEDVSYGYGNFHYDIIVVVGVPSKNRLDRIFSQNQGLLESVPIINIDFHRVNENYGAVNLIEPNASSLSEILVALAESLQNGLIDETIATVLLTGIIASTDRFTATHTTSKSLTVAAQLMAAGAKQQQVVKSLYSRDNRNTRSGQGFKPRPRPEEPIKKEPESKPDQKVEMDVREPETRTDEGLEILPSLDSNQALNGFTGEREEFYQKLPAADTEASGTGQVSSGDSGNS
jgi:hypothetical protein